RSRLTGRGKPYWRLMQEGLMIGYRKPRSGGAGRWVAKIYKGKGVYETPTLPGFADDFADADGAEFLNFGPAQERARQTAGRQAAGTKLEETVADALDSYVAFVEGEGRSTYDTRYRDQALIRPALGRLKVAELTPDNLRAWRDGLVKVAPRLRTKDGDKQKHRDVAGEDGKRARRASANRTWTVLRAALNHAFHDGKAASDLAWRKVKPFRNVDAARVVYLSVAEAARLVNACDAEFSPMVRAA